MVAKIGKYYNVEFSIGKIDLSRFVSSVRIENNVLFAYPCYTIQFFLDSKFIQSEKLNGRETAKISIELVTENEENVRPEIVNEELIIIKTVSGISSSNQQLINEQDFPAQQKVDIIAIPKISYLVMSTTVNRLFTNENRKLPIDIVKDLFNTFSSSQESLIQEENKNDEPLEQLIVPPMTFIQSIRYIDYLYGIYNGPAFYYCTGTGTEHSFLLWDLSHKIKEPEKYTVNFLSAGQPETDTIYKSSHLNKLYFSNKMNIQYNQNQSFITGSYNNTYITKPKQEFVKIIQKSSEDVFNENGITDSSTIQNGNISEILERRTKVSFSHVGMEEGSESFANSKISSFISRGILIQFALEKNISIRDLGEVGIPITVDSDIPQYINFTGKYLVTSNISMLKRYGSSGNFFNCVVLVNALRGNTSLK